MQVLTGIIFEKAVQKPHCFQYSFRLKSPAASQGKGRHGNPRRFKQGFSVRLINLYHTVFFFLTRIHFHHRQLPLWFLPAPASVDFFRLIHNSRNMPYRSTVQHKSRRYHKIIGTKRYENGFPELIFSI